MYSLYISFSIHDVKSISARIYIVYYVVHVHYTLNIAHCSTCIIRVRMIQDEKRELYHEIMLHDG